MAERAQLPQYCYIYTFIYTYIYTYYIYNIPYTMACSLALSCNAGRTQTPALACILAQSLMHSYATWLKACLLVQPSSRVLIPPCKCYRPAQRPHCERVRVVGLHVDQVDLIVRGTSRVLMREGETVRPRPHRLTCGLLRMLWKIEPRRHAMKVAVPNLQHQLLHVNSWGPVALAQSLCIPV